MPEASPLGEFLRWHRERLAPKDVGIPAHGRRRVPGLRREEVAFLAGISIEYYVRLEQGRERNPSVAVLDAIADALGLDADHVGHLHELARPRSRHLDAAYDTTISAGSLHLVNSLNIPAMLQNKYMDVLAANSLAEALCPNMRAGVNRFRSVFLDPCERELWPDWEQTTANGVAQLRSAVGADAESSPARALIAELNEKCAHFRHLWSRHDVQLRAISPVRVHHPRVGDLELFREKLIVAGTDGVVLLMFHAEPGSLSADRLALLTDSPAEPAQ